MNRRNLCTLLFNILSPFLSHLKRKRELHHLTIKAFSFIKNMEQGNTNCLKIIKKYLETKMSFLFKK